MCFKSKTTFFTLDLELKDIHFKHDVKSVLRNGSVHNKGEQIFSASVCKNNYSVYAIKSTACIMRLSQQRVTDQVNSESRAATFSDLITFLSFCSLFILVSSCFTSVGKSLWTTKKGCLPVSH